MPCVCVCVCVRNHVFKRTLYEAAIRAGCSRHGQISTNRHIGHRCPRAFKAFGLIGDGGVVCASGRPDKRAVVESFGKAVGARALEDAVPWSVWPCILAPWQGTVIVTSFSTPIRISGVDLHRAKRESCRTFHRYTKPFGQGVVPAAPRIVSTQVRYFKPLTVEV